jgi:hypothetical protein
MANAAIVHNQSFKRRHPLAVWLGLPFITLGIYYFVWWYKINDEARRFLNDESINPALSVLAVTLGALVIVPPFISIFRTTERIARMQDRAGMPAESRANPWISLVLAFLLSLNRLYMQVELNRIWDAFTRSGAPMLAPPPAPPAVTPPAWSP